MSKVVPFPVQRTSEPKSKHTSKGAPKALEPVDAPERRRALDPALSFLVQAPAGSGKTGLLVQRILRLLSVVDRPESIVAVTFTIKAAAEMRERVLTALAQASSSLLPTGTFASQTLELAREALSRDQKLGWNLLDDPSRLHIQTIDALCANLVRQMPLVSEAGGIGNVTEDADPLYRQAARYALQNLADESAAFEHHQLLRRLALHFDNNIAGLERQISVMLGKRDQWNHAFAQDDQTPVADFGRILELAEIELRDVFRQHNTVDFIEITRSAIKALGEPEGPSDLLYALDYRIEHILVDEFQDTSRAQYRLLDSLTGQWSEDDRRTLFLVGDPLQSIYGFRAAEVELFQKCWEEQRLGAVRLHPIRLQTNFRSTPELVSWVQRELSPVLNEDNSLTGAVAMRPAVAAREDDGPKPVLTPFIDDRTGDQEAAEVVRLLEARKSVCDTAILVRSRSHVLTILRALRRAGIRYEAVEIDPLGEQQHVLDLLALARALTHLADRAAWLACLRAPWCGLTLADLTALAEAQPDRTILDLLSDPERVHSLSADGRARAVRVQKIFANAVEHVGRMPLRSLLRKSWYALGGPSILAQRNQLEDAETFLGLIGELEQGGIILDFGILNERCANLYAKPDTAGDCVRVMTIHEAKGLEFDTVILPHTHGVPPREEEELLVWNRKADGTLEVAAQPQRGTEDPEYKRICEGRKQKRENESKRLFYVACTRAKNQLFLLGSAKTKQAGTDIAQASRTSFLGMIWATAKPLFVALLQAPKSETAQPTLFDSLTPARTIARLRARWSPPVFAPSIHWTSDLEQGTPSERPVTYEWVGGVSRHVGTVVHGLLRQVAEQGLQAWSESRLASIEPSIAAELSRLGVDSSALSGATRQTARALRNTLNSSRGKWILQSWPDARSEWPIGGHLNGKLISGTVDRVFRDGQRRLWIVDYKTSTHSGGQLDEFLAREQRRYREQMESYGRLLLNLLGGPVSVGLYFPLLDAWREWELAEAGTVASS